MAANEAEAAVSLARPLLARPVPLELEAVLLGVAEVKRLMRAVVRCTLERPPGLDETPECIAERGSRRVADGDVVEPGRVPRRGRAAGGLPRVEAEVVVIATCGQEEGVGHLHDDVEAEDPDVEVLDTTEIRSLQMHMTNVHAGRDRPRAAFARRDACTHVGADHARSDLTQLVDRSTIPRRGLLGPVR